MQVKALIGSPIKEILASEKSRQVVFLYLSTIVSLIAGLGISVVNTRLLGESQFGDLKFLQNVFGLLAGIVSFGVFPTASRLLARPSSGEQKRNITGVLVVSTAVLSLAYTAILLGYSYIPYGGTSENLGHLIRLFSPLVFVYPFQLCLESMMQGDNRIYQLSWYRSLPLLLYLAGVFCFLRFTHLTLEISLGLQLGLLALVTIYYILRFNPHYSLGTTGWSLLKQENKSYGFPVYVGSLAAVVSAQLGGVLIGYFVDNINVGYFSLATTVTAPIILLPNIIGTTFFKDYARQDRIPERVHRLTLIITGATFVIFLLVIKRLFLILYPAPFAESVYLSYILSIGCLFHGFGDFYNKFLGAHGRGRELRNSAILVGLVNLAGYGVITLFFGVLGAAVTRVFAGLSYFLLMFFWYKRFRRRDEVATRS